MSEIINRTTAVGHGRNDAGQPVFKIEVSGMVLGNLSAVETRQIYESLEDFKKLFQPVFTEEETAHLDKFRDTLIRSQPGEVFGFNTMTTEVRHQMIRTLRKYNNALLEAGCGGLKWKIEFGFLVVKKKIRH